MIIERIEAIPYRIPYKKPLLFASGAVTVADHVLVRLTTSEGVVGYADSPPRPYTYGETQRSIVAAIEELFAPALVGVQLTERERVTAILNRTVGNNAAKGAVDIAVWDAFGITLGQPVSSLLGGYTDHLRVCHMLGFAEPAAVLDEARQMGELYGITAFKIKVGRHPITDDVAVCRALRDGLGAEAELYVDGNRGWTANETNAAIPALVEAGISLLEEPNDAREALGRRRIVDRSPIPVVGDESVPTPGDVSREVLSGGCNAVCIKTARGGFTNALKVLHLCEGLGVDVTIGNQIDTQMGTAASLAFGAAFRSTSSRPAELSNYLDLADDLLADPLVIAAGSMWLRDVSGVGVRIDDDKVSAYRMS